jgi:hypothetical protein
MALTKVSSIMTKQATNVAELKTYGASMSDGDSVEILGYSTAGDGGSGTFYWDATSTATDNGGTIIQATGITTGRWMRVYSGAVNATWFGVMPDDGSELDQTDKIVELVTFSSSTGERKRVFFPAGNYYMSEIDMSDYSYVSFMGEGTSAELMQTVFHRKVGVVINNPDKAFICFNHSDEFDGEANNRSNEFRNIYIQNGDISDIECAMGVQVMGSPYAVVDTVMIYGFKTSMTLGWTWMGEFKGIHCREFNDIGFNLLYHAVNSADITSLHCSTADSSANYAVRVFGGHSPIFTNLDTEGSMDTHLYFHEAANTLNIDGWHIEGGTNIIEHESSTTNPSGIIDIRGLACFAQDPLGKFIKPGSMQSIVSGLKMLKLSGYIDFGSGDFSDYLTLERVLGTDIRLQYRDYATDGSVYWKDLSKNIDNASLVAHNITPVMYDPITQPEVVNGRLLSQQELSYSQWNAGSKISTLSQLNSSGTHFGIYLAKITIIGRYSSWTYNRDYAEYHFLIAEDGTSTQTTLVHNTATDSDFTKLFTFTYDNATQELTATAAAGVTHGRFSVHCEVIPY